MLRAKTSTTCRGTQIREITFTPRASPKTPPAHFTAPSGSQTLTSSWGLYLSAPLNSRSVQWSQTPVGTRVLTVIKCWRALKRNWALWETVTLGIYLNQPRLHMAADDRRCNHHHVHKQLPSAGRMLQPSFHLFSGLTIEAHWPRWLSYSLLMMAAWLLPRDALLDRTGALWLGC